MILQAIRFTIETFDANEALLPPNISPITLPRMKLEPNVVARTRQHLIPWNQ